MNYLAHLLLSVNNFDCQAGNLLADPLKGNLWEGASDMHHFGFELHRLIDTFTDSNPVVSQSKAVLKDKGYLKPVVIDVVYDHFLTKHWSNFATINLDSFLNRFALSASQEEANLSKEGASFISRLIEYKVLRSYKDLQGLELAFKRIDRRLSHKLREKESMTEYVPLVKENYLQLEADFLTFFPKLSARILSHIDSENHYLRR